MRPSSVIVEHQSKLPRVFCTWLSGRLGEALSASGRASLALTGGSVAQAFLPALVELGLPWDRLALFWGDERAVPPDSADSNYALAKRLLLDPAGVPASRVHRMLGEHASLQSAAEQYGERLVSELGPKPRLDVALLGIGPDGHVCSLFPGHAALRDARWVSWLSDAPKPPPARLTLTLQTLALARSVALAALGLEKAAIVCEVLEARDGALPAASVLERAEHSVLFLDDEAASLARARGLLDS